MRPVPFVTHLYRAVRVRLTAARIIWRRWLRIPPGLGDVSRSVRWVTAVLQEGGVAGLIRRLNAETHALSSDTYRHWIWQYEELTRSDVASIREATARMEYRPRLSVLMPVYNTDERWLRAAIESIQSQLYPDWELCVADDCSPDQRVRAVLGEYAAGDARVKIVCRDVNGHISAASNSALALASGDFVVLFDHDDVLPRHALFMVASELNRHPDADLLYSDEDKISEAGRRFEPYFKPDWSPELFYGQNMISHLGAYRTDIVRRIGGFREGFEGSQDYDLALRVVEHTAPQRIRHIPHILYHWRAIPGSTARAAGEKAYAYDAARRAIREHFARTGVRATCEPAPRVPTYQRIRYSLPSPRPHVTIIVPTRDRVEMLARCLESVTTVSTYEAFDLIVVDNGSSEPESLAFFERARTDPRTSVLRVDEAFNFSRLNNLAAARARGSLLCFLNNDTQVISPDWLEELASHAIREDVGAVGAMLYHPDDTIQHAGVVVGLGGIAAHGHRGLPRGQVGAFARAGLTQAVSAVSAACLMVRGAVFHEVGGFDERLAVAYNDVDFCLRLGARGYRNVWTPFAELYHFESVSRGQDTQDAARTRFLSESAFMRDRWKDVLAADPYYNPNLSLASPDFALARPPRHRLRTLAPTGASESISTKASAPSPSRPRQGRVEGRPLR